MLSHSRYLNFNFAAICPSLFCAFQTQAKPFICNRFRSGSGSYRLVVKEKTSFPTKQLFTIQVEKPQFCYLHWSVSSTRHIFILFLFYFLTSLAFSFFFSKKEILQSLSHDALGMSCCISTEMTTGIISTILCRAEGGLFFTWQAEV